MSNDAAAGGGRSGLQSQRPWPGSALRAFVAITGSLLGIQLGFAFVEALSGPGVEMPAFGDTIYIAIVLVSAGVAGARAWYVAGERLAWALIGAGLLSWASGEIVAGISSAGAGAPVSYAFHFVFYAAALGGLLTLSRRDPVQGAARLDAVIIVLGLATLWSWLVLEHAVESVRDSGVLAVNLAFPLFDLALCLVLALVFVRNGWPRSGAWLMIGLAFVLAAVTDSIATAEALSGTGLGDATLLDAAWAAGAMMLGIAALTAPGPGASPSDRLGREFSFAIAVVFTALATLVLVADHFESVAIPTVVLAVLTLAVGLARAVTVHVRRAQAESRLSDTPLRRAHELAGELDARDPHTRNRSERVALYTAAIAVRLGLDVNRVERLVIAGKLHDVGRAAVPVEILDKRGPLTAAEIAEVQRHPAEGERIIAAAGLADVALWVRHHHERWDGRGYPDGLSGPEIELEARILAAADALEAITTQRPGSAAIGAEAAAAEIGAGAGAQFDPGVARVVTELLRHGALELEPGDATPSSTYKIDESANGHLGVAEYMRVHAVLSGAPAAESAAAEPRLVRAG